MLQIWVWVKFRPGVLHSSFIKGPPAKDWNDNVNEVPTPMSMRHLFKIWIRLAVQAVKVMEHDIG